MLTLQYANAKERVNGSTGLRNESLNRSKTIIFTAFAWRDDICWTSLRPASHVEVSLKLSTFADWAEQEASLKPDWQMGRWADGEMGSQWELSSRTGPGLTCKFGKYWRRKDWHWPPISRSGSTTCWQMGRWTSSRNYPPELALDWAVGLGK